MEHLLLSDNSACCYTVFHPYDNLGCRCLSAGKGNLGLRQVGRLLGGLAGAKVTEAKRGPLELRRQTDRENAPPGRGEPGHAGRTERALGASSEGLSALSKGRDPRGAQGRISIDSSQLSWVRLLQVEACADRSVPGQGR